MNKNLVTERIYEYRWKGLNRFQQKQGGKLLVTHKDEAEKRLLAQGISHIRIQRNFVLPTPPKQDDVTQIIHQLALLVQAHIPLKQALVMIKENCQQIRLFQWLQHLILQIESGYSFSQALEKLPFYLSHQEIQLIKMGETSGNLTTILCNMAESRSKSDKLNKKIKKILFYPAMILFISISLSLLLLIFIVPQFAELYDNKSKELPFITQLLFSFSQFLTNTIYGLFIFTLILCFLLYFINKKTKLLKRAKFLLLGRLPIFSQIIKQARIVFFCQNCSLMIDAHIRLNQILQAFQDTQSDDPILQEEVKFMLQLLQQGYRFYEGLNPTVFDTEMIQMIAIGEQSGNLSQMLHHISEIYQQKLDYQIDILSHLLEPMLMLIMGVIVGTIMLGLYLPIFDMGALVE
ncbi:type II secretion system F family protein [Ursidibacter maritimus]|uniref:Type II secretion system F family protein n=5 Tax=Ursidibacter maritimus TaxID=1331689 RepID=A0A949WFC5_9PAST|nr:type II secretion system F family protein [Ursidibacter maritimus]KAE9539283.1 fimbrial protein [Ursidibacter maritimus]MBV6526850.1 type II secretion system F family protein [Ursidibacter maritimus]MBV6529860.1 type II secretion system F family protein [Ursidibacter maritimus]MBV6531308.1 type II secretion system F family protein [Ursidibacter maritimus]MBV6533653.1 type II secretion system F family protein [Ursidibacter maritimus]